MEVTRIIDLSTSPEEIKKDYEEKLKRVFDNLTQKFESSFYTINDDFLIDYKNIEVSQKQVIKIISTEWPIKENQAVTDFLDEINRQDTKNIIIPDIPTYQLSFALEEGTWIIFLREVFPKLIDKNFERLISLEKLIWSGKGTVEDFAYYLFELNQISENRIKILSDRWKDDHQYGTSFDLAPRIIAGIFDVTVDRAKDLFEGSKRLLKSKMKDLAKITSLQDKSPWALSSVRLYSVLYEDLEVYDKFSDQTIYVLITLTLLQEKLLKEKKKTKIDKKDKEENNFLINELNWNSVNLQNPEILDQFKNKVLNLLFKRKETNPKEAGKNLVIEILTSCKVSKNIQKLILNEFNTSLDEFNYENYYENPALIVNHLNYLVPNLIVKAKEMDNLNPNQFEMETLEKTKIWDTFEENLKRAKRIDDQEIAHQTISKIVETVYDTLVLHSISSFRASELIIMKFGQIIPIEKNEKFELLESNKLLSLSIRESDLKSDVDQKFKSFLKNRISDLIL